MGINQRTHPLDRLIEDDSLFFLEAMIPFVDSNIKKILVILIKIKELSAIMNSLNNPSYLCECGFDCHPKNAEEFISGMCNFMPDNYKNTIKQMQQMMSMMQMMNQMEDIKGFSTNENNENKGSLFDSIMSIIDNEGE